jgi:hypothetical protein
MKRPAASPARLAAVRLSAVRIATLALCAAPIAHLNDARAADAHVHGIATLQVVVDERTVRVDLRSPAHDILGFEHAPASAQETARAAAARRQLLQAFYRVPVAAGCRLTSARALMPGDAGAHDEHGKAGHDAHDHAGHDHEGHDHEGHEDGTAHGDVTATHVLTCRAPERMAAIDVHLFDTYPALTEVRVQFATATAQGERRTTPQARRALLGGG